MCSDAQITSNTCDWFFLLLSIDFLSRLSVRCLQYLHNLARALMRCLPEAAEAGSSSLHDAQRGPPSNQKD